MTVSTFEGQVAIVTGGSRGIGQAVARMLTDFGATVVVADLVPPADGGAGEHAAVDLTDPAGIELLVEDARRRHGHVDILVNNAGVRSVGPTADLSLDDWSKVMSVNLTAAFLCSAAVARGIIASGGEGAIVNVSSAAAHVGMPGRAAYCASKAGLNGLTRALAVEWATRGIRVNAVGPGFTHTHVADWAINSNVLNDDVISRRVPMRRMAAADEVAAAICFLASREASYVTGQVLYADGGWLAMGIEPTRGVLRPDANAAPSIEQPSSQA